MDNGNKFMIDTCSIGHLRKYLEDGNEITNPNVKFFITTVQEDEVQDYDNILRRVKIQEVMSNMNKANAIGVWGETKWGECYFASEDDDTFEKIKQGEEKIYNNTKSERNLTRDAIIATSCIDYGYRLITNDKHLYNLVRKYNSETEVLTWEEFVTKYLDN